MDVGWEVELPVFYVFKLMNRQIIRENILKQGERYSLQRYYVPKFNQQLLRWFVFLKDKCLLKLKWAKPK